MVHGSLSSLKKISELKTEISCFLLWPKQITKIVIIAKVGKDFLAFCVHLSFAPCARSCVWFMIANLFCNCFNDLQNVINLFDFDESYYGIITDVYYFSNLNY